MTGTAAAVPSGASTATAPASTACAMKRLPSSLLPGSAANSVPGPTFRESSWRSAISSLPDAGGKVRPDPVRRSASCNACCSPWNVDRHGAPHLVGILVDRRHAEQRTYALDHALRGWPDIPGSRGEAVGFFDALRLIQHELHDIARRRHGKGGDEGG